MPESAALKEPLGERMPGASRRTVGAVKRRSFPSAGERD